MKHDTIIKFVGVKKNRWIAHMITFSVFIGASNITFGQQSNSFGVSGTVIDANDKTPLVGVYVLAEGTQSGDITDENGKYEVSVPDGKSVLIISSVGYNTERIEVNGRLVIDVELIPDLKQLDEVVVIGYGTRDKRNITTAISTVRSADLEKSVSLSPDLALMGKTPGVLITPMSGDHSSRPVIQIRGVNSWSVADPLYVIDGVPITDYGFGAESSSDTRMKDIRGSINIMSLINPNDIESISVLKDASAAAIYGVRASNGVILINTKKGRVGKPVVQVHMRYGIQNAPKKMDLLNTVQYAELYREAYENDGSDVPSYLNQENPLYLGNSPTYDWQGAYLNENAPIQDYGLRVSGGSENTNYYFSGGYSDSESILREKMKRYTFSSNISSQLNPLFNAGFNFKFAYEKTSSGLTALRADLRDACQTPPWQPIYDDANPPFSNGYMRAIDENGNRLWGAQGTKENFLGMFEWNYRNYYVLKNVGNAYILFEPVKGLSIKGNINLDFTNSRELGFTSIHSNMFTPYGQWQPPAGSNSIGSVRDLNNRNSTVMSEIVGTYTRSFNKHNLDVLATASTQKIMMEYLMAGSNQIFSENRYMHFVSGDPQFTDAGEFKLADGLVSYIGRISYNCDYKYYIDLTVRRDGSSRFDRENRWGTFPAVSAAYRISTEPFMKNLAWLNDMKIRAGWGKLGNYETGYFAYLNAMKFGPHYSWGNPGNPRGIFAPGAYFPYIPNKYLTWETTSSLNAGADMVLFNNLQVSFEYYYKLTSDLLQQVNLPLSVGVNPADLPYMNMGKVENQGVEFSLNYSGKFGSIGYSVGGNLTTVKNKVVETAFHDVYILNQNSYTTIREGLPIGALFGYQVGGIIQNLEDLDNLPADYVGSGRTLGDLYFLDINGPADSDHKGGTSGADGRVDPWDQSMIGNPIPKAYYGLNLQFNYNSIDMTVFFNGIAGRESFIGYNGFIPPNSGFTAGLWGMNGEVNMSVDVLDRWTSENPSTTIPRASINDNNQSNRPSDRFVRSSSYLKLQHLQIGYKLPSNLLSRLGISSMRIWASGSNILTLTKWPGVDPDNDRIPIPRIWTTGIDVKF